LDALCKFHDFATSMEFEVDLIIPSCSVIHCLFEAGERFSDLARQDEADPHAKQKSNSRNDAQGPFSSADQLASFLVVQLDTPPILLFDVGRQLQGLLTGCPEVRGDLAQSGVSYLCSLYNLSIRRADSGAKLLNQLGSPFVPGRFDKSVQVFFISQHGFPKAFVGFLS